MSIHRPSEIAARPRPWLTRQPGECAFPVDGRGQETRSCCNPCGLQTYCRAHRRIARRGRMQPIERLLEELAALGWLD
ncbi:MAG: hypothetical protein ABSD80_16280 [Caulobacteraceae bacterium]|jgi:hypothetical protein